MLKDIGLLPGDPSTASTFSISLSGSEDVFGGARVLMIELDGDVVGIEDDRRGLRILRRISSRYELHNPMHM